uniref:Uncharacterized protein n=1 Tax=Propithecus coquereli TaxID=379532 RepID=A0A2K6ES87_PROCO
MFLHSDSRSSLGSTKPTIVQGVDTHMHQTLDEVHGCPGRDWGTGSPKVPGSWDSRVRINWPQSPNPLFLPAPSLLNLPLMKDRGFPAGRNGLTQTSFTYQVPSGWGSPWVFFLPRQECGPLGSKTPCCHTCPVSPGEAGAAVDGIRRTPAP